MTENMTEITAITFISKEFSLRSPIKTTFKDSKNARRFRNYVLRPNLYPYFLIEQNLPIFGEKMLM